MYRTLIAKRYEPIHTDVSVEHDNLVVTIVQNLKKLANLLAGNDQIHSIFLNSCRAERLEIVENTKRRTKSRDATWFVNSLGIFHHAKTFFYQRTTMNWF